MNILIVDDNANNRLILSLMLDDYEESTNIKFNISEAVDGQEAINMCKDSSYDVVFMDIMMPNVDGIQATKVIKEKDSHVMIIAVSAVDDNERIKLILNYGAEDYIPKPVNADLFVNRINNYFSIIKSREHKIENKNFRNVFSSNVYNRFTKFIIDSDETLAEFWECFLFNPTEKFDNVSNVVRTIFSIAEAQLKLAGSSNIYTEESEEFQYFTMINISALPLKVIELIIKKSQSDLEYKIQNDKLSFKLEKVNTMADSEEIIEEVKTESKIEPEVENMQMNLPAYEKSNEKLQVFDYLDEDDQLDLEEYASKLSSLMLIVGSGDISEDEVLEMHTYLERIGQILSTYSEIYPISLALSSLASTMQTYKDTFITNSEAIGPMCKAFSNDMSSWIQMSFYTGAPSIDFMNDTIAVNTKTIEGMLSMDTDSEVEEDLDDIFDF